MHENGRLPGHDLMGLSAGSAVAPQAPEKPTEFKDARRVLECFSSGPERKVLTWLAQRMPAWVNSDHLTFVGFISTFLAGASYALARWDRIGLVTATLCLALNWFGDSLDGTLARVRNRQRPRYGFYVDHMIDTFGALFLMAGLATSGYVDTRIAVGMLVAFLMLSIEVYLTTYTLGEFVLTFWKLGPTEIRILLAIGNVTLLFHPTGRVLGSPYRLFDVGGVVAIAAMATLLVRATVRHVARLYKEERLPKGF